MAILRTRTPAVQAQTPPLEGQMILRVKGFRGVTLPDRFQVPYIHDNMFFNSQFQFIFFSIFILASFIFCWKYKVPHCHPPKKGIAVKNGRFNHRNLTPGGKFSGDTTTSRKDSLRSVGFFGGDSFCSFFAGEVLGITAADK